MEIPPLPPTGQSQNSNPDPLVDHFNELWDKWYNSPTKENAQALLDFLNKPENHDHFANLAKNAPFPKPKVDFEHSYDAAKKTLTAWMDHGCDPNGTTAPSEFISDVSQWVNWAK